MKTIYIEPAHRLISMIALLQVGVVIGGTLFVRTMLKVYGYGTEEGIDIPFRSGSVFIRHYGFLFFLVPITWTLLAIWAAGLSARHWQWEAVIVAGTVLIGWSAYWYFVLGMTASGCVMYAVGS